MAEKRYAETPLMKQYNEIKAKHPGTILLFRVGDFYETFGEDAIKASSILGITLTRRANGAASFVELAGFPHHSIETYLPKLVRDGQRVAICEQLEDPKTVKGIVKRGVTELVTPGVTLSENILTNKENTFLAAVCFGKQETGVAFLDISTGEFCVGQGSESYIDRLLSNFAPKEVLFQRGYDDKFRTAFGPKHYTYRLDEWVFATDTNRDKLCRHFNTSSLKGFGIDDMGTAIAAAGAVLYYLDLTEHKDVSHINTISRIDAQSHVWIDRFTSANLELFSTNNSNRNNSFFTTIDRTSTQMGGRMLRRWIAMPLRDETQINQRLDTIEALYDNRQASDTLTTLLEGVGDLERIASRVSTMRALPRELISLKSSLELITQIKELLSASHNSTLETIAQSIEICPEIETLISSALYPDPMNQVGKGGVIGDGVDMELDDLRRITTHGKEIINQIQEREIASTGITSLKISFNNVFGYYIEVRNTHKDRVPEDWVRKQTLTGAERYITAELKEYEQKILGAQDRIVEIETKLYEELLVSLIPHLKSIQNVASVTSRIDCLNALSLVANQRGYCRPTITSEDKLEIIAGRHPVIETLMPVGEAYVPNDLFLNSDNQQIIILTGPNMSGKSALLRQTALIVLMAQMGSFVPCSSATIGLVDKIFTRVGASDNLSQGESTFMVEMLESASILNNISGRSLVLLDEIGRGTSTYDGISIAWAMVEYIHNNPRGRAKTLFATHYHELNDMETLFERVKNFNVSIKEIDNKIIFMRKLMPGGTEHSFGIHVAQMAGMPKSVIDSAKSILETMESRNEKREKRETRSKKREPNSDFQLTMFQLDDPVLKQIRDQIRDMDIDSLTPIEALNKLNEIKNCLNL